MMTIETRERGGSEARLSLPRNLSPVLDNKALAALVLEAVRRVGDRELNPPVAGNSGLAFRPRALLALLTYCYAIGVYGSQDVEVMMYEDADFRALFGMEFPDWKQLRNFRRHNPAVLRQALEETFKGVWRLQGGIGRGTDAGGAEATRAVAECATEIFEGFSEEAQARLERAMFIDHMAME